MEYKPQVTKEHYRSCSYDTKDRWVSYWYQIHKVLDLVPKNVLEIGPGNKTVTDALRKAGTEVTAVDIAPDLQPDVIASVLKLPFGENSFDAVLCAEVLEHLPFDKFTKALAEIHRVSKRFTILSLPHAGYVFSMEWKSPLLKKKQWIWKLPFFWKVHRFNGEHYWELGKRGYSVGKIKRIITAEGFVIREGEIHADDPAHYFFVLEKK